MRGVSNKHCLLTFFIFIGHFISMLKVLRANQNVLGTLGMKFVIDAMSCKNNTVGIHYHI